MKPAEHEQAAIDRGEVRRALAEKRRDGSWASAHTDRILVDAAEAWLREHEQAAQDAESKPRCPVSGGHVTYRRWWCLECGEEMSGVDAAKYLPGAAAARAEGARAERGRCFKIATDLVASWPGKAHVVSRQAGMMIAHAIRAAQDEHGGNGE